MPRQKKIKHKTSIRVTESGLHAQCICSWTGTIFAQTSGAAAAIEAAQAEAIKHTP